MLVTIVEDNQKAPFSIVTTLRCRGRHYSFPWCMYVYVYIYIYIYIYIVLPKNKYIYIYIYIYSFANK